MKLPLSCLVTLFAILCGAAPAHAQPMPMALRGSWRITRILPTADNKPCWTADRAKTLLGTTLIYREDTMVWQGGAVTITEALPRDLSARDYRSEYNVSLSELGIRAAAVTEYDLQHEDADVTGATTEVPGDTVLVVSAGHLVVQACGVFYSAVRVPSAAARRP